MRESLIESRGFPLNNSGDLNNRKKWSRQNKENKRIDRAKRAVNKFAEDFQRKLNLLLIMIVLKVVFDNVEGPKLSFEEKYLADSEGIEFQSTNCEIDVIDDDDEVLH